MNRGAIAERDQPDVSGEIDRDDIHDEQNDRTDDDERFAPDETDAGRAGGRDDRRRDRDAGDRRGQIGREREGTDRAGGDRDREREQARRNKGRHLVEPGDNERRRDERTLPDGEAHSDRAEKGNAETEQL